jgi:predicted dienelactone hydrolase
MLSVILSLFACSPGDSADDTGLNFEPLSWSVQEGGPFRVGFRTWEHSYEVVVGESPRRIPVNIWYPSTDTSGESSSYLEGLYKDDEAFLGARVAAPVYESGFPVHVYSHGHRGWGATSADMMRFFASHGWVVIAPDHTDNTLLHSEDPLPSAHYLHRPLDVRASLDALEALENTNPLSKANTSTVLLSGHSFGSYTVWGNVGAGYDADALVVQCGDLNEAGCTEEEFAFFLSGELADPRVAAGITMAGAIGRGFFGEAGHLDVQIPLMLMSGTEDHDGIPESWESLQGMTALSWLELDGGCHQSFATGICSTLDTETGFGLINAYALALGRSAVLGDQSEEVSQILDGSLSLSSLGTYSLGASTK